MDEVHGNVVDAWLRNAGPARSAQERAQLFRAALIAVWSRAHLTLGEITLTAVLRRAQAELADEHPLVRHLSLSPSVTFDLPRDHEVDPEELARALHRLLVRFLGILDGLTDSLLTDPLVDVLRSIPPNFPAGGADGARPRGSTGPSAPRTSDMNSSPVATDDPLPRIQTGVPYFDEVLHGGIPRGSLVIVSGPPGSGKSIFSQQVCFRNASAEAPALLFNTLSEPTARSLAHLRRMRFFDRAKLDSSVHFVDVGGVARDRGLGEVMRLIVDQLGAVRPAVVVIDSFKAFDDLARAPGEQRRFGYELAVALMAWQATVLLLGEYAADDLEATPLFSIADGLITLGQRERYGEHQRYLRVVKMRGGDHSRAEHVFAITDAGLEVFPAGLVIRRAQAGDGHARHEIRICKTGVHRLDEILGGGFPYGSAVMVGGVSGTGKTTLILETLYRGAAELGEKGILFTFDQTEDRLRAFGRAMGWDIDGVLDRGLLEIVFIPQPEVLVEAHLVMMRERIVALGAKRIGIDSLSVFLHKVGQEEVRRQKVFQLVTIVQEMEAIGLFSADLPLRIDGVISVGVEEVVVDGVILLSGREEDLERQRYVEVLKLRYIDHLRGLHNFAITPRGIEVFPRYSASLRTGPPKPLGERRLRSGVPGLDQVLGGGLLERSATLVCGSPGAGKTTLALQFLIAGARAGEPALFVSFEEGPPQVRRDAEAAGLPIAEAHEAGMLEFIYLSRLRILTADFLTILMDKIRALKIRRIVLDCTSHMESEGVPVDQYRRLLYSLVTAFKHLDVTSLATLETSSMSQIGKLDDRGLAPIADNYLLLRYAPFDSGRERVLEVVKSRCSDHSNRLHRIVLEEGGLAVGEPLDEVARTASDEPLLPA